MSSRPPSSKEAGRDAKILAFVDAPADFAARLYVEGKMPVELLEDELEPAKQTGRMCPQRRATPSRRIGPPRALRAPYLGYGLGCGVRRARRW